MKSKPLEGKDKEKKQQQVRPRVVVAAIVSSLGGLVFGWNIGGGGGTYVMPSFREEMGWPPVPAQGQGEQPWVSAQQGLITALFSIGAMVGAMPSGYLCDTLGRKKALILMSAIFTFGMILEACTFSVVQLCIGQFIGGLGVGALSMMCSLYQSEMAPDFIRGKLVTLLQLSIVSGILITAILNVYLAEVVWGWRVSYAGNGVFSIIMILCLLFMPESPRWLVSKGRIEDAKQVLTLIRMPSQVDYELHEIEEDKKKSDKDGEGKWSDLLKSGENMRYRLIVGVLIQFAQQWTGINAIMYFAPSIFSTFMETDTALWANVGLQTLNFLATFICIALIDKVGRRVLLISGGVCMAIFTLCVAVASSPIFFHMNTQPPTTNQVAFTIVGACGLYICAFAYSWGPIPWVVCAEIFPNKLRGKAMSVSTATNWLTNFLIAQLTPIMYNPSAFNLYGTFLIFGCCCVIMTCFIYVSLPELSGHALENIGEVFATFRSNSKVPCIRANIAESSGSDKSTVPGEEDLCLNDLSPRIMTSV